MTPLEADLGYPPHIVGHHRGVINMGDSEVVAPFAIRMTDILASLANRSATNDGIQ